MCSGYISIGISCDVVFASVILADDVVFITEICELRCYVMLRAFTRDFELVGKLGFRHSFDCENLSNLATECGFSEFLQRFDLFRIKFHVKLHCLWLVHTKIFSMFDKNKKDKREKREKMCRSVEWLFVIVEEMVRYHLSFVGDDVIDGLTIWSVPVRVVEVWD